MPAKPAARRLETMSLDDIAGATRNPRAHDLTGIGRSIGKFGYVDPVVLDERTGRLVSGHGRVESLRKAHAAGDAPPEGIEVGPGGAWLVPVLRGWASRSDEEADAYLIAANRLTEKGGWDDHGLAEILTELADVQMLELTGYNTDELDDLVAALQEAAPVLPAADWDDDEDDEDDPLARQTVQSRGLDDLRGDYEASNQRVLVLSYPGGVYVWVVNKLAALMAELEVDTNSDAVLKLLEDRTGEHAPLGADAADPYLAGEDDAP